MGGGTRRIVSIRNSHPRLRLDRRAVARVIYVLDGQFKIPPFDLHRSSTNHKSEIINRNSPVPPGELSLVFLTDPALAKIHGDFMGDPTATDVITFEGEAAAGLAGEICVSADTAAKYVGASLSPRRSQAKADDDARGRPRGTPLQEKFSAELTLYLVHGWLHLAGYDDLQPAKKRRMRAAEKRAMALLHAAKAVPAFRLA
ncbi:MAG: rRNA maturation RNAse YbeY [Opitutae bacterium]|nr:rRNA maturation RNAse YbeY [Opitutae bacterium]